jgi:hypothetical protein
MRIMRGWSSIITITMMLTAMTIIIHRVSGGFTGPTMDGTITILFIQIIIGMITIRFIGE